MPSSRPCFRRMKVSDFLRLCEIQRQMQSDPCVSEDDIFALEDEFVSAYGELPSCHICGEPGHIQFQCPTMTYTENVPCLLHTHRPTMIHHPFISHSHFRMSLHITSIRIPHNSRNVKFPAQPHPTINLTLPIPPLPHNHHIV